MKRNRLRSLLRIPAALVLALILAATAMGAGGFFHRAAAPQAQLLPQTEGRFCALRAPGLPEGAIFTVLERSGSVVHTAQLDAQHEALLGPLPAGEEYLLRLPDGTQGRFYLEENASVTALEGPLRADGEVLYCARQAELLSALPDPPLPPGVR